ncbi:putative serine esterase domain containing protein [Babesia divergens]|uniref:Serine esterase domain containing protein n=1 Tax=Babesia divergens TaxID=32595 RepID=A0AAD9G9Q5_BABDI|nr:putative serine esterase domain containing protein [Babesia divergens]
MADAAAEDRIIGLCYHCKVRETERTCFADDTTCFYDAKAVDTAKAYWQLISEQVIKEKNRAQTLATLLSAKVMEIVKFFGNTFADLPIDLKACKDVQLDMFAMPESIKMCDNCKCFFSRHPPCHCSNCMGEDYRSHYVILMHGVLAEPFQLACIAQYILKAYPQVFIYFPHNVAGKTLVGLELVLDMFSSEILSLFEKVPDKIKISLIGHSFGGVILRYWLLFYSKKTPGVYSKIDTPAEEDGKEEQSGQQSTDTTKGQQKHRDIDIEWCNYISLASPHSGIYENHTAFRKVVSFIGSQSVDQLDNESVDMLLLLSKDGRESMRRFQNVVVYGNLSGDMLVAPRTSILLPYHKVSSKALKYFLKVAEELPGVPQHVCELLAKYEPNDESEDDTPASGSEEQPPEGRDEKMTRLLKIFCATTAEKIRNTQHIQKVLLEPNQQLKDGDDESVFMQVFTPEEMEYFKLLVSQIVDRSSGKVHTKIYNQPSFLYNEIMLAGLWEMTQHKFAVYLPTICMPHHSIITIGELGTGQKYTQTVLSHVAHMFVP